MAKNKGLGRGIEALFADNDIKATTENVEELALDTLTPNPYQPRTEFDDSALKDLTRSIKASGVFQPIIVRKTAALTNHYEILAGERRFRASKLAGRDTIPAIVRDVSDEQMMEIAVMENLQREDLSPLEEAEAYNTLMTQLNITQAEVSKRLGKSRSYIANYLRLLGLPTEVKTMLKNKQLSMGQARTLLSVKNKADLIKLAHQTNKKTLTVRQLEKMISAMNSNGHSDSKMRHVVGKSPFLRAFENELQDKLETVVSIKQGHAKNGSGKIEINYASDDDLTRILQILNVHLD
jgi:ParB family transcriptional regulator, chromosome partitioning protein